VPLADVRILYIYYINYSECVCWAPQTARKSNVVDISIHLFVVYGTWQVKVCITAHYEHLVGVQIQLFLNFGSRWGVVVSDLHRRHSAEKWTPGRQLSEIQSRPRRCWLWLWHRPRVVLTFSDHCNDWANKFWCVVCTSRKVHRN